MKILAIETSSKICGTCLLEDNKIIDKLELNNGLTHSESLMPLIENILNKNNLKLSNIDSIICDVGPGSFTGIRIGVATSKAFVDSLNLKYTGVSSLEALAYNIADDGLICSIIDARNENCYFALYNLKNSIYTEIIKPTSSTLTELFEYLKSFYDKKITFVGDGVNSYKEDIQKNIYNVSFALDELNNIDTSKLALAGFNKLKSGKILELSPLYLKKPQAQRQLEEKQNANKN